MNAHAYLTSQGWRGTGHSLHKTDDSIGLAKPLLVSKKDGNKGLGQKQHFTSDQWWSDAFDEQLKGLDTSVKGKVVQTVTAGRLNAIEKQGLGKWSLYASFVRGGLLEGTISDLLNNTTSSDSSSEGSDVKKTKKSKKSKNPEETSEERRARKDAKRKRKEERAVKRAARRERKKKSSAEDSTTDDARDEKRRRRAKKEEKRRKRQLESTSKS